MGAIVEEEVLRWETMRQEEEPAVAPAGGGERIRVWIRLRPLNEKEIARNEVSDWECIDDRTIMFRNSLPERAMFPDPPRAYSFDRVFRPDYTTRQVYEEAAKHVVLSVVSGINSTIFAYGQTSSGKTFTMNGITEYSVADVYDYMQRHQERAFVLKFSAMEIYNEAIRDLLNPEGIQLRVLDDPERGTIVEKLSEEILRDLNHMKELLSLCAAQRQVGETSLNETSSRSHQILRLTIESSAREFLGKDNSSTLSASVNFVDLAGSERASQMLSSGTRLKEGCHINRSLLTLGTVIRKLSNGRNTHIPFRESKLTRILQPSLGGNARTAIICTMCPSRSHLEQSKNTLLFATCAKEVATHAQVNVVMSDKALVKHLQKELARLENELRSPHSTASSHYEALLRTKNAQIQKMEKEIKELTQERNLAQSRLKALLCVVGDEEASKSLIEAGRPPCHAENGFEDEVSMSESSSMGSHSFHFRTGSISQPDQEKNSKMLSDQPQENGKFSCWNSRLAIADLQQSQNEICISRGKGVYESCKDVECVEVEELNQSERRASNSLSPEGNEEYLPVRAIPDPSEAIESDCPNIMVEGDLSQDNALTMYAALERQLQGVQKTLGGMVKPHQDEPSMWPQSRLHDCYEASHSSTLYSSGYEKPDSNMHTPPRKYDSDFSSLPKSVRQRPRLLNFATDGENLPRADSHSSALDNASEILEGESVKGVSEDNFTSIQSFVAGLKEMAQLQYEKQLSDDQGIETETSSRKNVSLDPFEADTGSPSHWPSKFQRQQREIIMLWHECNVSLVHRTYFFMLFKGDQADSIYIEVELRRLSFLKTTLFQGNCVRTEGHNVTIASSIRALRREREMLSRQMQKRLSPEEREKLYQKWGIGLNSKRRKLQLARSLWTGTGDMDHISESASVIANLVGLSEQGQVLKEMFGLSFSPQTTTRRRSFGWKNSKSSLL